MMSEEKEKLDTELTEEEAAKFVIECESVIDAIKNGDMAGDYFEF